MAPPNPQDDVSDDGSRDSQLEWEISEGIPGIDEPFIQNFLAGRKALIAQEKKQRHDALFKQTMSPIAKQAGKILASIRKRELLEKWTSGYEESFTDRNRSGVFPGMMFTLARDRMETTELWRILERMPKGALLHAHLDAMFDIDWLIEQVLSEQGMCIKAEESLSDGKKREVAQVRFEYCGDNAVKVESGKDSIWDASYVPGNPVPVKDAQRSFPDHRMTFKEWVLSRTSISAEESLWHHQGLDTIWRKFQSCFRMVDSMLFYEPIFRKAFSRLLGQLAADGISYVEFRMCYLFEFKLQGQIVPEKGYARWFEVFDDEIKKFQATEAGKGFRGARMIWTCIRAFGNRDIAQTMKDCISMKQKFPHLIAGFDCVGQEDVGRTLKDLTPLLFWFKKKCHEEGVDLPFFFHAGECLGDGDSTDENLFDAILLGTRRIGHGYSLFKHPLLIDMVKEKKIMIESCPISNEILRLSSSILAHTLPALLSRGVAVSLNNDDPAILGHGRNGLTHDFWQSFMAFENMGLEGLAAMAENSLRYSCPEDQKQAEWTKGIADSYMGKSQKATLLKQWRSEFEKFCQWVIMEYPLEAEDSEEEGEDEEEDDDDDNEED